MEDDHLVGKRSGHFAEMPTLLLSFIHKIIARYLKIEGTTQTTFCNYFSCPCVQQNIRLFVSFCCWLLFENLTTNYCVWSSCCCCCWSAMESLFQDIDSAMAEQSEAGDLRAISLLQPDVAKHADSVSLNEETFGHIPKFTLKCWWMNSLEQQGCKI